MNRFIQFKYDDQPFLSIVGENQHDEILLLHTALQPALSLVDELDDHIRKAKVCRRHPSDHGLTEDQSAAVYLYTDNYAGQSLPDVLNAALQSGDQTRIEPWIDFIKLFKSALNKLPPVNKTIWRGLPIDIFEKLQEHDEFVCGGFTSCSATSGIIEHFLTNTDSVLCSIEPLNGKAIRHYAAYENDEEILLFPDTRLRVKNKRPNSNTEGSVICLEEINDISEESTTLTDVTMASPQESVNEEDIDGNSYRMITSTTKPDTNEIILSTDSSHSEDANSTKGTTKAVITFTNGDRYELAYEYSEREEKATGEGICIFPNGDLFIGTFEHGSRHGQGILYKTDESIEVGTWINDESTSQVLQIRSSGNKYEWKDRSNPERWYGVYNDGHGNRYIGNVRDDQAHGLGVRFWSDGSRYEGNFQYDKKRGYGKYYYTEQDVYTGQWENDEIHGLGELRWRSGTTYEGGFSNGKRNGRGKLLAHGKIQEGQWENDEYVGSM